MEERFFICVTGLIFHKDSFLILQRSEKARGDHFFWGMPGGKLEFGESPEMALEREIFEETGLEIVNLGILGAWDFLKTPTTQVIGITYLCQAATTEVQLSFEHINYRWIQPEQINKYQFNPGMLKRLSSWEWDPIKKKLMEATLEY